MSVEGVFKQMRVSLLQAKKEKQRMDDAIAAAVEKRIRKGQKRLATWTGLRVMRRKSDRV